MTNTDRPMSLSLHLRVDGPIADAVALARRAEEAGADGLSVIEGVRDPFVPLAAMAAATTTLRLGTYVANAAARTPQATATVALNLADLSDGRFTLGIGVGNRHLNEWLFGLDTRRPMATMRDYLTILGAFLRGIVPDGEQIGGHHHHMQRRYLPRDPQRVPVVMAAAGPRMIELAGAMTDGVGVGVLVSPEHLANEIRPRAERAAKAAGHDPGSLRFPMAAMVCIDRDESAARLAARRAIAGLFHPVPHPYYDFLLRAQGYADVADACDEYAPQKRWNEALAAIGDDLLDRLTITGTPEQCAERLRAYEGVADEVLCLNAVNPSAWDLVLETIALVRR
ncbi:MAG: LLM class flavin-dependent oxidoreductase [Acidimicrobiales bacterium]